MAVLPDKIQEFFDSWDEAQQTTGTAWNDFFGGNTWDLMTPAQQQAVTEYYFANETINQTYQNMKSWFQHLVDSGEPIPDNYEFLGATTRGGYYKLSTTGNKLYPGFWVTTNNQSAHNVILSGLHFLINFDLYEPEWNNNISYSPNVNPTSTSGYCNPTYYWSEHWLYYLCYDSTGAFPTYYHNGNPYTGRGYNQAGTTFFQQQNVPNLTIGSTYASAISLGGTLITININPSDIPTASPWDYYNDLLPDLIEDLPENVPTDVIPFYPSGYDPGEPVDPDPEDADIEDIDGSDEELNYIPYVSSTSRFITSYILSESQLNTLGNILWTAPNHWGSGDSLSDSWKNFLHNFNVAADTGTYDISNIMEFIISLQIYPINLSSDASIIGLTSGLKMGAGYTDFLPDDDIYALTSYVTMKNLGGATVPFLYDGDYRDFANTKVTVHLPYCGSTDLPANVVSGKNLVAYYAIDFMSGNCTATVKAYDSETEIGYVVASLPGKIGFMLPVTATNQGQVANKMLNTWFNSGMSVIDALTGNLSGAIRGMYDTATAFAHGGTTSPMITSQDMSSMCLIHKPYIIVTRSRYKTPTGYTSSVGRPSTMAGTIGSFTGWTKFVNPDLSGIHATENEKAKILDILESGVFV